MVVQLKSNINSVKAISAIPVYRYRYRSSKGILRFILQSAVSVITERSLCLYYAEIFDTWSLKSTTLSGMYGAPYHPVECHMPMMFRYIYPRSVNQEASEQTVSKCRQPYFVDFRAPGCILHTWCIHKCISNDKSGMNRNFLDAV